jgi:dihydrofolate reductase
MATVVVEMTASLDGFVNNWGGSVERLYPDLAGARERPRCCEAIANTGAVVMGRRAYEMANGNFTGYEFQVPIFVVTHHPPTDPAKGENARLSCEFVGDVDGAVAKAKTAARRKRDAVIGGASTVQQCLRSGLADELHVGIVPVLFGGGLRLSRTRANCGSRRSRCLSSPNCTDIKFRILG